MWSNKEADFFPWNQQKFHFPWNAPLKDMWGDPKLRVFPDGTRPDRNWSENRKFLRIFSGRVESGQVGSGNFVSDRIFLTGVWDIFPGDSEINLHLKIKQNKTKQQQKSAFDIQTEQE